MFYQNRFTPSFIVFYPEKTAFKTRVKVSFDDSSIYGEKAHIHSLVMKLMYYLCKLDFSKRWVNINQIIFLRFITEDSNTL